MAKKSGKAKKSSWLTDRRIQLLGGGIIVGLLLVGLVIPLTAMQFENHNSFCASCHTQDEDKFYQQSLVAPVDLASFHESKGASRCIDCHTGPGIIGRYGGLMAGATDLISYFSGHYPQPAALEEPYPDANCLKCHGDIARKQDFNNHFHVFLSRWQALDRNAATCVSCHVSHDSTGDVKIGYLNEKETVVFCDKCHSSGFGG